MLDVLIKSHFMQDCRALILCAQCDAHIERGKLSHYVAAHENDKRVVTHCKNFLCETLLVDSPERKQIVSDFVVSNNSCFALFSPISQSV